MTDFHPTSNIHSKKQKQNLHLQCFSRILLHVLFLKYVDNDTVTQICESHEINLVQAKALLFKAKELLSQTLVISFLTVYKF